MFLKRIEIPLSLAPMALAQLCYQTDEIPVLVELGQDRQTVPEGASPFAMSDHFAFKALSFGDRTPNTLREFGWRFIPFQETPVLSQNIRLAIARHVEEGPITKGYFFTGTDEQNSIANSLKRFAIE